MNGLMNMALAMALVLLTWTVWLAALVGLGLLVQRAMGRSLALTIKEPGGESLSGERVVLGLWMGLAALVAIVQLWNYIAPVNSPLLGVVFAFGAIGLGLDGRAAFGTVASGVRGSRGVALASMAMLVWLANRSTGPGNAHDSGFYHFNVVRWANEHPVVPGLANLGSHLGLNSSSLLLSALFNTGPWAGRGHHVYSGLLLAMLAITSFWGFARLRAQASGDGKVAPRVTPAYWVVLLVPCVMMGVSKDASSPKTDLAPGLALFAAAGWLIGLLRREGLAGSGDPRDRAMVYVFIAALSASAVCFKLSAGVVAAVTWLVATLVFARGPRAAAPSEVRLTVWRPVALAMAISTLLVGSWMGRNLIMSGYPLYPSTALGLPDSWIDWKTPREPMLEIAQAVNKHPKGELPVFLYGALKDSPLRWYAPLIKPAFEDHLQIKGWEWLRPWFFALPFTSAIEIVMPLGLAAVVVAWLVWTRRRTPTIAASNPRWLGVWLVPVLIGLVAWFVMSPGPRFGYPMAWMVIAGLAALVAERTLAIHPERSRLLANRLALAVAVLCVPVLVHRAAMVWKIEGQREGTSAVRQVPFVWPGPDRGFHATPTRELELFTTRWGLGVWVPEGWNKGKGPRVVWDCPLPSVAWPDPDPDLRLRREGDLSAGFRIDRAGG